VSKQFKLKLVDGNYAFAFKKPGGYEVEDGVASRSSVWSERFELYYTTNHQDVVTFTKTTRGDLLHYKRRSESALLPEKVLPENAEGIVSELGLESINDLYSPVYGESVVDAIQVVLADLEDLPDAHNAERPTSKVPAEAKWQTYADYIPYGTLYDGLLPGYLEGYSKALAKAIDDALPKCSGIQVWTHKAHHGEISGYREVTVEGFEKPFRTAPRKVSLDYSFSVGKVLKASSLEDAVRKFDKQVQDIVAMLTTPMRVGVIEAAA
jgi:hypothetical protein